MPLSLFNYCHTTNNLNKATPNATETHSNYFIWWSSSLSHKILQSQCEMYRQGGTHTHPLVQLHDAVLFKIGVWLWFHVSRISFVPGKSPLGRREQTLRTTQRDGWKHTHSGYTSFTLNPALSAQLQGSLGCCSPQLETERYNAWVSLHTVL